MKHNREFEIAWQGLKPGEHTYVYEIGDKFMQEREPGEDFKDWQAQVTLKFDKQSNFFLLHFDVDGSVTVPCDRCGADFGLKLWDEFDLVIKLTGDETTEKDDEDDVVFIPHSETVIDISNWLYEYVMLSVPLQHIHPDKADGEPGCDPQVIKLLNELSGQHEEETKKDIWKGLEALKTTDKKTTTKKVKGNKQ